MIIPYIYIYILIQIVDSVFHFHVLFSFLLIDDLGTLLVCSEVNHCETHSIFV